LLALIYNILYILNIYKNNNTIPKRIPFKIDLKSSKNHLKLTLKRGQR
jgi:hypothetical protein